MSNTVWGIVWVRDEQDLNNEPSWYESEDDAVYEFNQRDDKYWASRLVTGEIVNIKTVHDGLVYNGYRPCAPWERNYEGHYYEGPEVINERLSRVYD